MSKVYGAAVIGCGVIADKHLEALDLMPETRVVKVCDIDETMASQKAADHLCGYTLDYRQVLEDPEVDSVHILTPHYLHTPMILDALAAGKHVVSEKPVSIGLPELEKLTDLAAREPDMCSRLAVIMQNRYNPTAVMAKKIIKESILGNLISVRAQVPWYRSKDYYMDSAWRGRWTTEGGGLLINQAIHTLDLMQWTCSDVCHLESIKGRVDNMNHPEIEVEDTAYAMLWFSGGVTGNFYGTNSNGASSAVEMEWLFDKGTMRLRDNRLTVDIQEDVEHCGKLLTEMSEMDMTVDSQTIVMAEDMSPGGEKGYWGVGHQICIEAIYKAFGDEAAPEITVHDAAVANEMVLGIYASSESDSIYKMTRKGTTDENHRSVIYR